MLEMVKYEEMAAKAILSFGTAIIVLLGGICIMGIELTSCNPMVLVSGAVILTVMIWLFSVIKL